MVTYFVIYDPFSRMFVRQGNRAGWCTSLNNAKHCTSEWSANAILNKVDPCREMGIVVKKIVRY